jgi:hypothetical protein
MSHVGRRYHSRSFDREHLASGMQLPVYAMTFHQTVTFWNLSIKSRRVGTRMIAPNYNSESYIVFKTDCGA